MITYHYDKRTGEFLGTASARPDPMEPGKWLIPAGATTTAPPDAPDGYVAAMVDGAWGLVEDHRDTLCWVKATAQPVVIAELGPISNEFTTLRPPAQFPLWAVNRWGVDTAAVSKYLVDAIDAKHEFYKYSNFLFNGHYFYVDEGAILDIERTNVRCIWMEPTDPIPTPPPVAGGWLTADKDEDGKRVVVPMTVAGIRALSAAVYDSRARLWAVRTVHVATLEGMFAAGASLATLLAYDITAGWVQ